MSVLALPGVLHPTASRRDVVVWHQPGNLPPTVLDLLADEAAAYGGRMALRRLQKRQNELQVAYVHGEQSDLWWEFTLMHSFRWQGYVDGMEQSLYRRRVARVVAAFRLETLLGHRVEDLSTVERTRAELAVALMARPALLLWEEPFAQLDRGDSHEIWQALLRLVRMDRLPLVAVAAAAPGLAPMFEPKNLGAALAQM